MAVIDTVHKAADLDDLLQVLSEGRANPRVIAGGTDILLQYGRWEAEPLTLVDITAVDALLGIEEDALGLRIGAATPLADLVHSGVVRSRLPILGVSRPFIV